MKLTRSSHEAPRIPVLPPSPIPLHPSTLIAASAASTAPCSPPCKPQPHSRQGPGAAVLAAVTFLGETFSRVNAVGLCVLILGVVLFNYSKYRKVARLAPSERVSSKSPSHSLSLGEMKRCASSSGGSPMGNSNSSQPVSCSPAPGMSGSGPFGSRVWWSSRPVTPCAGAMWGAAPPAAAAAAAPCWIRASAASRQAPDLQTSRPVSLHISSWDWLVVQMSGQALCQQKQHHMLQQRMAAIQSALQSPGPAKGADGSDSPHLGLSLRKILQG